MYRKSTYIKQKNDLKLVQIEEFDSNEQLTYIKEINREGTIETRFLFDENNNVTKETNFVDEVLSDISDYVFDKEGNLLSHKFIIENEVIEETSREVTEETTIEVMFQNGEEAQKTITEYKDGESTTTVYEFGNLAEKKITSETKKSSKSIAFGPDDSIIYYENYFYDENDQIIKHEILNPDGEINSSENYKYDKENLTEISFSSYEETNCQRYFRDENNNLIKFEIRGDNDRLIHHASSVFDSENREIEKTVFTNGNTELFEIKYEQIN